MTIACSVGESEDKEHFLSDESCVVIRPLDFRELIVYGVKIKRRIPSGVQVITSNGVSQESKDYCDCFH